MTYLEKNKMKYLLLHLNSTVLFEAEILDNMSSTLAALTWWAGIELWHGLF